MQEQINLYKEKLVNDPENKEWLYNLAMLYLNVGDVELAFQISEKLLVEEDNNSAFQNLAGLVFQRKDLQPKAIEHFNRAVQLSEDNQDYMNNLAISYVLLEDYENASVIFERAVDKGKDLNLFLNYAVFLYNRELFQKAEFFFEKIDEQKYLTENYYVNYSNLLLETRNFKKAEQIISVGIEKFRENLDLQINIVLIKKDIESIKNLLSKYENNLSVFGQIASKLKSTRQWESVALISRQILSAETENKQTLIDLAEAEFNLGNFEKAVDTFNNLIKMFPSDSEIFILFSDLLKELGQLEFALKLLDKMLETDLENQRAIEKRDQLSYLIKRSREANEEISEFEQEVNIKDSEKLKVGILLNPDNSIFSQENFNRLKDELRFRNDENFQFTFFINIKEKPDYEFLQKNDFEIVSFENNDDLAGKIQNLDIFLIFNYLTDELLQTASGQLWLILPVISDFGQNFNIKLDGKTRIFRQKIQFFWKDVVKKIKFELIKTNSKISVKELLHTAFELTNEKKLDEAVELYNKVLQREENCEAYFRLGYISGIKNDYETAIGYYYTALKISPGDLNIYSNIGTALKEMKKFAEAETIFQKALEFFPENELLLNNTAIVKSLMGKFDEAQNLLERALKLNTKFPRTYVNLAILFQSINDTDSAIQALEKAMELQPEDALSHFNYACCLLRKKNFKRGLQHYEWRKKLEEYTPRVFLKPELNTKDIEGKKIYVYDEQGFGDTLQFSRYLKLLKNKGAKVYFECHTPLISLFEKQDYIDVVCSAKQKIYEQADYDFVISLLSLPLYFEVEYNSIYSLEYYINIEKTHKKGQNSNVNIGFVWKGRLPVNNLQRATKLENFEQLFRKSNLTFYSLQKDNITEEEKELLEKHSIKDYSSELNTFLETAKIVEKMDLILTIDTSVAHLAGALGKTVWLLLPFNSDWRWFEDKKSVWYPKMKIFRQKSYSGWSQVFSEVFEALNEISK